MGLRVSSRISRWIGLLSLGLLAVAIGGCAGTISGPSSSPRPTAPPAREEPLRTPEPPSPRALASLQLTEHARMLLERGKPDDAISVLERAINLNPANGQNYYYLSEAWLMKENPAQAEEFNRLAAIYLEGNVEWMVRIADQMERIREHTRPRYDR